MRLSRTSLSRTSLSRTSLSALALSAVAVLSLAACGGSSKAAAPASDPNATAPTLRLGYFANVTHASAVYGVGSGDLQKALGVTKLTPSVFGAGPAAIEALRGDAIDAAFLGPSPAVNGYTRTDGSLLRIIAGTTSGGVSLVVAPGITDVAQLAGKKVATPQLGNTQDVAAKAYFKNKGVSPDIVNQENAQTLDTFKAGAIAGAWVPEPWASRLQREGGGTVLLDEASRWPQGRFVTTQLVVSQKFLNAYPGTVKALLQGLISVTRTVATKSPAVLQVVNDQIKADTGKALAPETLAAAFTHLTPTLDPVASSLVKGTQDAVDVGVTKSSPDLKGIYDLRPLNALLTAAGAPTVSDDGLGVDGT